MLNVPSKVICRKTLFKKLVFVGALKVNDENSRIRIRIHLSEAWIADPDLFQNVMDPQHCLIQ
jgi:hypothetical protein